MLQQMKHLKFGPHFEPPYIIGNKNYSINLWLEFPKAVRLLKKRKETHTLGLIKCHNIYITLQGKHCINNRGRKKYIHMSDM